MNQNILKNLLREILDQTLLPNELRSFRRCKGHHNR